jgi:YbgC/YbaW family acyl-CoA thioester hydrolase
MIFAQIPTQDFVRRVFESEDRVLFSYVDAYGHLNSAKYLEMVVNHRVHALEEQIKCFTLDILKSTGVAIVIANAEISFVKPSFQSEKLVIQSWADEMQGVSFSVTFKIFEKHSKQVRSTGTLKCVCVDLKTNRPCVIPDSLPTRGTPAEILNLPLSPQK